MTKTLEDAGILELGGEKLTKNAEYKFVQDVMDAMRLGSGWDPIIFRPCGPEVPPIPVGFPVPNLHDKIMFVDFYKNQVTKYLDVCQKLNIEGAQPFVPLVFDPIVLAFKLGLNIPSVSFPEFPSLMLNIPKLLLKLNLMPIDLPDLMAKLPSLGIPPQPFPPQFKLPSLELPYPQIMVPTLFLQYSMLLKIPLEIPKLLLPTALIPLFALQFSALCGNILKILPAPNGPNPLLQVAVYKVLAVKLVECIVIDVVGLTLGSASGGAVGGLGKTFGYVPPPSVEGSEIPVRDKIINFAKKLDGISYSSNKTKYTTALFPDLTYKNDDSSGDLGQYADKDENNNTGKAGTPKPKAYSYAKTASSCGLFARACLIAAGISGDNFFDKEYVVGTAISGLLSSARKRNALLFDRSNGDKKLPKLQKGDMIIVGDDSGNYPFHVEVLLEDYSGDISDTVSGIGGGASDKDNLSSDGKAIGSKISSTTYQFAIRSENGYKALTFAGPTNDAINVSKLRPVLVAIDSEKMVNYS